MPRRATKPFEKRCLVAPIVLEAINQVLIEPGDDPVTELELMQAYYSVERPRRPSKRKDTNGND